MKKIIIILKFLFILTSLSLISCVKKQDQISNKSLGRFGADSISISYPSINHILNIGNPISIAPNSKVGKITACGIKYGTGSLPPGLFLDAQCNISGTPLVLAFTFNYKITAISEFNTTAEANITITVGTYYNLGGAVTGLGIGEIITISNGIDSKIVTADGDFNLSPTSNGDSYTITVVESNRSRFRCTVLKGSGVISQNINNIQINCLPYGTRKLSGALSGLIPADGSVQVSNAGVNVKLTANGTFKFGPLNHGTPFNISVTIKPPGYECTVSANGVGVLNDDIIDVAIICIPPPPKKIYVKVIGLNTGSFTIQNNSSEVVTVNSDGVFEFQNKVIFNTAYSVAIITQPDQHNCTISNATGIALADVTNISITCSASLYSVSGLVTGVTTGDHVKFVFNDTTDAKEFDYNFDVMGSGFTLPRTYEHWKQYRLYLTEVPSGKKCKFTTTNPTPTFQIIGDTVQGFINASSVSDLNITCSARDTVNCEFGHLNYMSPLGTVMDMVCDGTNLYVAGNFLDQGLQNGYMSEISSSLLADYKQSFKVEGGGVRTAATDEAGGMYIAGDFTKVNGQSRNLIARLYKDGSIDQRFNPLIVGPANIVAINKIIVKDNFLYIGGVFSSVESTPRQNFAKINRFTGELHPLVINFNNSILDMSLRGTKLALGGNFTVVSDPSATVKACLAEIDTDLDQLTPLVISFTNVCTIFTLASDSSDSLFVGGSFQNAGNIPTLNHIFKIKSNNELDSLFSSKALNTSSDVYKIKVINEGGVEKLIVGGNFTNIFGSASSYIGKYNIATNTKEAMLNTSLSNIRKISEDNSYIFITDYLGRMARYLKTSNTPDLINLSHSGNVLNSNFLENINGKIYGSDKYSYTGTPMSSTSIKYLFRYNLNTGRVDSGFDAGVSGIINSIALDGSKLIIAGGFNTIGGLTQKYLARINLNDASLDTGFTPNLNSVVTKIALTNSKLIILGSFTIVDNITVDRSFFVSLNPLNGAYLATIDTSIIKRPVDFVVHINDLYFILFGYGNVKKFNISTPFVVDNAFTLSGKNFEYLNVGTSGLYVSGSTIHEVSGVNTSRYLSKFDLSNGDRDIDFKATTGGVNGTPYVSIDQSYIYTSGATSFLKLQTSTGNRQLMFDNPFVTGTLSTFENRKVIEGATFLIVGGSFNLTNGNSPINFVVIPK